VTSRRAKEALKRGNQWQFADETVKIAEALLMTMWLSLSVSYSVRNAVVGFTCMARRAGRKQARSAATASNKLELIGANGSLGDM
jgi:hypothetical protein